ncbi:hypothetical protein EMIHUDRAFT_440928 [Emiliania huxleyi CCMP1516]|uniref:Uncharacterized protein n=2 Tax=Emiliania huxleyi TaxID=2903 RepID=A0A0D3KIP0_EMIH1|nr:hypothetical protein EMIHUDRAFT_440928 [Emiliania huxleyi CCMP1516]EOD35625.1 hypothetical protein EMIHUDRAFT_440928 [Emiliania huxleyi CCMP1516]|eukprot:XP_005788054.1 hypothetical protein EMIHUDRAFT_440928 [Emiliania huxleyi CCMP1516]
MPHPPWAPKPPKPPSSGGLLVQEAVPLSALYDLAGHSYEGRGAELIARRAHAGIEGTSVRVMRYPPSWSCVPPSPRPRAPHHVGPRATLAGLRATRSEGPEPPEEDLKGLPPLWFHATVTARHPKAPEEVQAVDLEYKFCCLEPRFGDSCDTTSLNILLPELCVAIEGLAVDLIDRSSSGVAATSSLPDVISARWEEPTAAEGREGLFGKLSFVLQRPVLFQLVAEARRLSVRGKKALQVLNPLIGTRREMRIEADVELTRLTYSLIFREEEVHWSISDIHLQLARDGSIQCRSAEGGLVEWLLRAVPAKLLEIINKALQDNLRKEQPLFLWRGDAAEIGALDGFYRELSRLAWLKQEVMRSFRDSGAS